MYPQYSQLCFWAWPLELSRLAYIKDAVLLKFNSITGKNFAITLFTILDSVKLRKLPRVLDYTMKIIRNQEIGTMNQLQNVHLWCFQNNIHIEGGEKEK